MPVRRRVPRLWRTRFPAAAVGVALACAFGCAGEPASSPSTFELVSRISLDLGSDHFIGRAMDLARDEQGWFYIPDAFEHTVWVVDSAGREVRSIGRRGNGPGELEKPVAVAISGDTLAVLEGGNARISFFTLPAGEFAGTIPQHGAMPSGIAFSPDGRKIAVSHSYGESLFSILTRSGEVLGSYGSHPSAYYVVPVNLPGGHMSLADGGGLLVSVIRAYVVLRADWNGNVIGRFTTEPAGFQPMDLATAGSRSDVEQRVREWTPLGRPIDHGSGIMVQWSEPEPVENSGRLDYRGFADFYTYDGELVASRVESPCLFFFHDRDLLYCLDFDDEMEEEEDPTIAVYRLSLPG